MKLLSNAHGIVCLNLANDRTQFVKTNAAASGVYGVFLPRQIDGIEVYGGSEGFQIQFGKQKVLQFCLLFPNLPNAMHKVRLQVRNKFIACISAFKTPSPPNGDGPELFWTNQKSGKSKEAHHFKNHSILRRGYLWRSADKWRIA